MQKADTVTSGMIAALTLVLSKMHPPIRTQFCCLCLEVFYSFGCNCMRSCLSILILTTSQLAWPEWLSLVLLVCYYHRFSYSQVLWLQRFPGCSDKAATAFLLGCGTWSSFCAHTFTWKRWWSRRGWFIWRNTFLSFLFKLKRSDIPLFGLQTVEVAMRIPKLSWGLH